MIKILTIEIVKNIYYNYFVMHPIITFNSDDYENELLCNLTAYFDYKNYNTEICDYIINVTPEVLKATMFILNLENEYIITINKMTHETIDSNKAIYLVRDSFTNCEGNCFKFFILIIIICFTTIIDVICNH